MSTQSGRGTGSRGQGHHGYGRGIRGGGLGGDRGDGGQNGPRKDTKEVEESRVGGRLGKKERPPKCQQYANFRNEEAFPTFGNLPGDNDIDLAFYRTVDGFSYMPQKHWCFLAEIVNVELFIRLRLIVRDKAGITIPVAFHTEGRGSEFAPFELQRGYTVAILYTHEHGFLDLTTGIRVEEHCAVKILPFALAEVLRLNDQVHQYSIKLEGKRICHGCNEKKASLQKCARCSMFWYCNKSCQIVSWNEKGHKRDCKILRDSDIQAMFFLDWGHFEDFITFPL